MIGAISLEGEGKRNTTCGNNDLMWGRLPYTEGGREKYSTSTEVAKKIFWKLESVVCRASVMMLYGLPGKMARTIAGSFSQGAIPWRLTLKAFADCSNPDDSLVHKTYGIHSTSWSRVDWRTSPPYGHRKPLLTPAAGMVEKTGAGWAS